MLASVSLSPNGPRVSQIIFGTWRLLDSDTPPTTQQIIQTLELCLELGISTIDTAEIYGLYTVEAAIGAAFKDQPGLREQFQIISKCGIDVPSAAKSKASLPHYNSGSDNLIACAEKSLSLLNIDHLDILLVHRPDWFTAADDTAAGLDLLLQQGKILHAGVSNYSPAQFDLLNDRVNTPLVTNQLEFSLLNMEALDDGSLTQCEQQRLRPMAWSPLGGGRLYDPNDEAGQRIRQCMQDIRPRYHDADDSALALAWIMAHPAKPIPILGTTQAQRISSSALAAKIKLERQDWYALWQASTGYSVP
ncbi:MAG: aldo/keto reductase [Verrucomicrobiales bacterium]|nr:aldo/keto reductase [Verrucomicrobiales bacterium]